MKKIARQDFKFCRAFSIIFARLFANLSDYINADPSSLTSAYASKQAHTSVLRRLQPKLRWIPSRGQSRRWDSWRTLGHVNFIIPFSRYRLPHFNDQGGSISRHQIGTRDGKLTAARAFTTFGFALAAGNHLLHYARIENQYHAANPREATYSAARKRHAEEK